MKKLVIIGMIMAINSTAFAQVTTLTDLAIVNPSFEFRFGDIDVGWDRFGLDNDYGGINFQLGASPPQAQDGSFFASAMALGSSAQLGVAQTGLSQLLGIAPSLRPFVDSGIAVVDFRGFGYARRNIIAELQVDFFDATSTVPLDTIVSNATDVSDVWTALSIVEAPIPVNTEFMKLSVVTTKSTGLFMNAGFDNISGTISVVPTPGAFMLGSIGVGFIGWLRRRKAT